MSEGSQPKLALAETSQPHPTNSATPREVRCELAETIEDIGSAMSLLREATNDTESGNLIGGKLCGSDALEILSSLETRFSQMAAKLATWTESSNNED